MNRTSAGAASALILGAIFLAGCAKEPTADLEAARKSMDDARAVQAEQYAPGSWALAEDAQVRLDAELDAQRNAAAFSRSYAHAKTLAADVRIAADKATQDAEGGKVRMREEAQAAIDRAKTLRTEVATLVEHAPQGKGTVANGIKTQVESAERSRTTRHRA